MLKNISLCLITLLSSSLFISTHVFADADWKLRKDKKGIQIFTREVKGSDFHSFKGIITLDTNLSTLMAVHTDVAYVKEWMKDCDESEMLSELTPTGYTAYFKTNSPWPVKDRDYALQYTIEQDKADLAVKLSFRSAVGLVPKADDCVRITELEGFWKMEPLGKQQVKVTYQVEADPSGNIPAWLANNFVVDQPYESLQRLRNRVTMEKYQNKSFDFIQEP
ncbi:MAG: START domain-containing protein [Pseudomonadales bacterium]|nr:START domain-containing protein [Pseudomonadales bacterium]